MLSVLTIIAPVFLIVALGYAALRWRYLEPPTLAALSTFVLRVAMPALVFSALTGAPLGETMDRGYIAAYCAGSLAIFALGYLLARRGGRPVPIAAMQGLGMAGSNSGSVGYPILAILLGPPAAQILAQTMIVENLVVIPLALVLAETSGGARGSLAAALLGIGRTLVRTPLLIAIAAGVAVAASGLSLPAVLLRPAALLGTAAIPLSLFVVGGRLAQLGEGRGSAREVGRIVAGKLVGHPLAVGAGLMLVPGLDPMLLAAGLVFAAAPMMSIYPIFGARFGMAELSAAALLMATILAAVTVTALVLVLNLAGLVVIPG